ncbi:Tyrosine-protein phosphatase non-receptor type 23 [Papilio machaon]|uniref:Tyrosine-protein phosphatase non-receptor type 23 n=1 Tax=Papilio machaon TaxID=76193 RepID=A0A194QQ86_PAPMA|nr:Tyrosine-protein phosphatase non-receptor type 23 [Papilio machaon]
MEAVPKLPLISFELKVSPENTHFGPKLKQYIAEAYREDPDSYANEIHQLEGLRSAAVRATIDAAGLSSLNRYFCQLRAMQSRFPMAKGQPVACTFAWKDLYANMSCSLADIRFEMASILYNIGALHTQLGAAEARTTPDSLKAACTHYQQAAWAFSHLKEQFPQPPGADVSSEILSLLQEICFAQAQECILNKSIQDTRKPSVIGAVATQVLLFYKNSLAHLGPSTGTDNIHEIIGTKLYNQWHRYLSFKAAYIGCIVCLYQGLNAEEQQKFGERVAFYQQSVDKLAEVRKLAKYIEPVQVTQEALTFTNDVVEGKRKAAKNENEFIYHEEVPEKDLLMDLKPACLVKAVPINFNDPEISGTDIFSRLVPMGAHEAASLYSEEKAKLLRLVVSQVDAKNTELTEFMSSLQIDQLEVLDSDQKIPQEIVDRCAAMNAKTEIIQSLVDSMNNLAEVISDVEHSLSEIKAIIQEETLKEKEYQKVMGPRPPSIVQTEISREFHKYQEAHTRTNESNQVLHKAMTLHIANLKLLSQPLDVLQAKIPSIDNIEGLDRDTMKEMRRVVGKAREMQTQRDALVQQLRAALTADDVTAKLLARTNDSADDIFREEIEKHAPKVKIIEQNLAAQENIINKLTTLYATYAESRRLLADVLRKRDGLINALVTSYDAYEELLGKSQKGLEFYRKMSHNVTQLLARLRSTCQVLQEERQQMLANQNNKAVSGTPASIASAKIPDTIPVPLSTTATPKLKDYLPYMKNRGLARSRTPQEGLDRDTMKEMRRVVGKAREMQTQRDALVQQLRAALTADDVTAKLLARTNDSADDIFREEIEKHAPKVKIIEQNLAAQENIINKLTTLYATYAESRRLLADVLRKRDGLINALVTSYDAYEELLGKSQKGLEFYRKMSHNVTQLLARLRSTCQVLQEERQQMLANQNNKAASGPPASIASAKIPDTIPVPLSTTATPKLKDYLPYMKNRGLARSRTPQATDMTQMSLPDGVVMPPAMHQNPYGRYGTPYAPSEVDPYAVQHTYAYPVASKANIDKPIDDISKYSYTSYTPPQYSSQMADPQTYTNPYYSATHNNATIVTDSQASVNYQNVNQANPNTNANANVQSYNVYDPYSHVSQAGPIPDSMSMYNSANQEQLTANFAQMQVTPPVNQPNKSESSGNLPNEYSQTFYTMQYQHVPSANMATYSHAPQDSQTSSVSSQLPSDYSLNYNYTAEMGNQYPQSVQPNVSSAYGTQYQDTASMPQNYMYTNAESAVTSTTCVVTAPVTVSNPYNVPAEGNPEYNTSLSQLDALDKPIKSHVTGEALSSMDIQSSYQNYTTGLNASNDPNYQTPSTYYQDQNYQNHPGYTYNNSTGNYDYNYGSQNSYSNYAGVCNTVQSPSDNPQIQVSNEQPMNTQIYYNHPYGYQNTQVPNASQLNVAPQQNFPEATNYTSEMNHSTYMQSGVVPGTNVTYIDNQVSPPKEKAPIEQNIETNKQNEIKTVAPEPEVKQTEVKQAEVKPEVKSEPTAFDLLSDIDFNVDYKPLMPEIKVPQVSDKVVIKPTVVPKTEPISKPVPKEETIERPAKQDIFSDPSLLNKFTQEVKQLHNMTDSLTNKTVGGVTILDAKWKMLQDVQMKENMSRTKTVAMQYSEGNIASVVAPFDDSRVLLKSDPDAYINASYYKQLAPWCIPLMISKCPTENDAGTFWKAILEYKIACVVCLLSEIEMQGISYWPTAKGQSLDLAGVRVSLEDVTCTVHWTERKLALSNGKTVLNVTHYQINVFPAKGVRPFYPNVRPNWLMQGTSYWPTAKGQSLDLAGVRVSLEDVICTVHWTERKLALSNGKTVLNVTHYQINVFPAKISCSPLVLLCDRVLASTFSGRLSNQLRGACVQCGAGAGRSALLAILLVAMCQVRAGDVRLCDILESACINLYKHRTNVLEDTKYLADAYKTVLFYAQGVLCSGTTMFNGEAVSMQSGAGVLPRGPTAAISAATANTTPTASDATATRVQKFSRESFEEMRQSPGLKSGDMKDPLNFLDPLWSLKKK